MKHSRGLQSLHSLQPLQPVCALGLADLISTLRRACAFAPSLADPPLHGAGSGPCPGPAFSPGL